MKRLLLISTGGTIASVPGEQGLAPGLDAEDILSAVPGIRDLCTIECMTLFNLDSSNIQPEEWRTIAVEVFYKMESYDGIVILHGTDTMAYSASILSFMLRNLHKPVVFTGSQLPIGQQGTDGIENLTDAVIFALEGMAGVYIVFNGKIIQGCRAVKVCTMSFDAFESINAPYVGFVDNKKVFLHQQLQPISGITELDDRMEPDVFLLKLIPGTRPEFFDYFAAMGYKGLVVEGFGLGVFILFAAIY